MQKEYSSLLTQENIESCIKRIRKEEGGRNCDKLVETFVDLMTKLDIKISSNEVKAKVPRRVPNQSNIVISRKDKKIQTSFSFYPDPALDDIFLAIRTILLDPAYDYSLEEYCNLYGINRDDPSSKLDYRRRVKTAKTLDRMFSEDELGSLPTTSTTNDDLEEHLIELDDIYEYNKLCDLSDTVQHYDKLLSQYGYDAKKGEWNRRDFPITHIDNQIDGIESDIQKADKAIDEYNEYLEYLAEKYDKDVDEIGKFIIPIRKKD